MSKPLNILFLVTLCCVLNAQIPNTDLWLFRIKTNKQKATSLTHSINITNRAGYDNQPSFSTDNSKIYYVSVREDNQADIYYYTLKNKKTKKLTATKESEYSPIASENGRYITNVMVEVDSSQRIHFINTELGFDEKKFDFDSVGYYTFLNQDTVIYYKLTSPHSLRYFIKNIDVDKWLCDSPIRTFKALNRHTLIYGIKDSTHVIFYKYNFLLRKAEKYCDYPSTNEDIAWHNELGLIKSEESKLLRYDDSKKEWILLYDLTSFGIKKITRFAFDSENKFLVVVNNL